MNLFRASGLGLKIFIILTCIFCLSANTGFSRENDLEFTLDIDSPVVSLPNIFKPNIDLSGRGFHHQDNWPQVLAAPEAIDVWQKDIGFTGLYRIQYSLWEISQLAKDKESQNNVLNNYEDIIKKINDAGGIVILDIFSAPAGWGKALDKKSAPWDLKAFKELIKRHIRNLSCDKRYNIWYELWSAPDLEDFFLGRKQEYLNLYRAVAESIKELEAETKIHIPLGGPAVSWWFQNLDGNTIVSPERSLIYDLIKFCFSYRLPLNFITWHAYSTDPKTEKEITGYKESVGGLLRKWLSYFHFEENIPLIIDEWNYDRTANVLSERQEKSYVCASFIPSRIKNMYEAGIDYQLYFSLEDFQNNKEGVVRNTGIFWFDPEDPGYKGGHKASYNVFRMLANLGNELFLSSLKLNDEFAGVIASRAQDQIVMILYNYIDPEIAKNYLSRNLANLNDKERRCILDFARSNKLETILARQLDISKLRVSNKVKTLLNKAQDLNDQAARFLTAARNVKIEIKNLKDNYLYQRYLVDSTCSLDCAFAPVEEKEVAAMDSYQETLALNPYSVNMIVLKKKPPAPPEPEVKIPASVEQPVAENKGNITNP